MLNETAAQRRADEMNESLGPVIRDLLSDGKTTDILLNPGGPVYADGPDGMTYTGYDMPAADASAVLRMVAFAKRQPLTWQSPIIINGSLPGYGYRISGTRGDPVTPAGPSFAIRIPIVTEAHGFATAEPPPPPPAANDSSFAGDHLKFLEDRSRRRKNIVIAGAPGAGKSFLAGLLINQMRGERVLAFEDKEELVISAPNHVRFISVEGVVSQRRLLELCLRYRGHRIIAGELLDGETTRALIHAANTGCSGFVTTAHANSAAHVPQRLASLCSNLREPMSAEEIADAIDVAAFVQHFPETNTRAITEVVEFR